MKRVKPVASACCVFLCMCVFHFWHAYGALKMRGSDDKQERALQLRAVEFEAELKRVFLDKSAAVSQRSYDLGEVCQKYFPSGTYLADVRVMMARIRGGGEDSLWPVRDNYFSAGSAPNENLASGFYLQKQLFFNSFFSVVFKLELNDQQRIASVVSCGVINSGL